MTIQYIWSITRIKAYPTVEDKTNVICTAEWKLTVTNGDYNKQIFGTISIPIGDLEIFTPHDELTEEQVLGWVHNAMGLEQIAQLEAGVLAQLEEMISPPIVTIPLPWVRQPGSIGEMSGDDVVEDDVVEDDVVEESVP
jgi:hypothetical protein